MNARARVSMVMAILAATVTAVYSGCGLVTDKDRIRIAKIGDEYITRGDLKKVIRGMPSDERPEIRTKGDVRNALEQYLDRRVKEGAAEQLAEEGKIHVPRERAEAIFRAKHPELYVKIENPEDYALTQTDLDAWKEEREIGIDRQQRRLLAEEAVYYLIQEALRDGLLTISEDEYRKEYEIRRGSLVHYEYIKVRGVYFPAAQDEGKALEAAAAARQEMTGGASARQIQSKYAGLGAEILEMQLRHDPRLEWKFGPFWQQASGAEEGTVLGPIFIRGWVKQEMDLQGKMVQQYLPDAYLVCEVVEYVPETPKTLEEAKSDLDAVILYTKMLDRLREKSGVEVYEDKLPDPSMYETRSVFQQ